MATRQDLAQDASEFWKAVVDAFTAASEHTPELTEQLREVLRNDEVAVHVRRVGTVGMRFAADSVSAAFAAFARLQSMTNQPHDR